ncbi:MAG: type II toxin-antitoxin system RelE/ParE family toxin, partial [Planctomycetaceae bacterium]|nr:type II toxin-antitoxin system RelE/ParE family toxin [Planctomycetaceae bacterium]
MPRIERTSRAKTDAVEIWAYIAEDNVSAADDLIDQIESRLAGFARMPESAEAVSYIAPD